MFYIYIVPINVQELGCIEELQRCVEQAFGVKTKCRAFNVNLPDTFDLHRKQYNSSLILRQLIAAPPADAYKILGITGVDLFIPILTYVFGEAQLDGIGAVVSLHRLNNQFYGLPEDTGLMHDRLLKEAVHELGHTFGLLHCFQPGCVLNASTYVEDIDQKSRELCFTCRETIRLK
jgi:archaemetzincin